MIARLISAVLSGVLLAMLSTPAWAIGLLRDPDIERGLQELSRPILNAAGLSPANVRILIVNDPSLNAFIIDHRHIFIHYGLIQKVTSAEQLQAVIAHEAAHIAHGHVARRIEALRQASRANSFGLAIAIAAAAGGQEQLASGIAAGSAGSAKGALMKHSRSEESSADQSAFRYLRSAGIDPAAMAEVFEIFRGQEALSPNRRDPWARSHPLSQDRIRSARAAATGTSAGAPSQTANYWFARIQGKLTAFTRSPNWTLNRAKGDDDISLMRRAIAFHRNSKQKEARAAISKLVSRRPKDPYFRELQGQILLESRDVAGAVTAYRASAQLAPRNALIMGSLGRALLAQNTSSSNAEALRFLEKARGRDSRDSRILRDLGTAYARAGKQGHAILSAAEAAALRGDVKTAVSHAKRASGQLPRGSAAWQRAQDLLP